MKIQISPVFLNDLQTLRNTYFDEIRLSQELFLEWMIADGSGYEMLYKQQTVGYFIKSKENVLLEFYLQNAFVTQKEEIFKHIINEHFISNVYCKSFDFFLLGCCHTYSKSSTVIGTIFRDYTDIIYSEPDNEINIRLAEENDISFLVTFDSDLYESPEELHYTVSNKMVYLFEKCEQLIGCGYLIKILPDKPYYDVGMWVNPDFRQQGYATKIISHLKKYCFEHGFIPICGCAVENVASQKTLENNGFYSKYCIIDFTI